MRYVKREQPEIMDIYLPIFETNKTYIFLKSGRAAGKSKAGAQLIFKKLMEEEGDIFVGRSNYSDLEQSVMAEIMNVADEFGLSDLLETRTRPLKIINKVNGNKVLFKGIGGADIHRTKGYVPDKEYWSLIVMDELQEVDKQMNLDEAMDTLLRRLAPDGKILYMFNPDRNASHWCNEYYRLSTYNEDFLCIHSSYKDIARKLNSHTLKKILLEKDNNPSEYRYRYLGESEGLFGVVYASFDSQTHVLDKEFIKDTLIKKIGIHAVIIGADPASTKDATALVPILLLKNGQAISIDYFYHDPTKNGVVPNDKLSDIIREWLDELMEEYKIPYNFPIDMIFDTNAVSQDLMYTLDFKLPNNFELKTYSGKKVIQMADQMRSAFSRNLLFIGDNGGYKNYITGNFVHGSQPLIRQLETVIWNKTGDGFDKNVPNDLTDALTYAAVHYFKNKGNMYYPEPKDFYKPYKERGVNNE